MAVAVPLATQCWPAISPCPLGVIATSPGQPPAAIKPFTPPSKPVSQTTGTGTVHKFNTLTRWPPFCRRHFQMHFLEWKCLNFYWYFTKDYSRGCNWWYTSVGSGNGLAPTRRQAIIWTNDHLVNSCIYASFGLNELNLILWNSCQL